MSNKLQINKETSTIASQIGLGNKYKNVQSNKKRLKNNKSALLKYFKDFIGSEDNK